MANDPSRTVVDKAVDWTIGVAQGIGDVAYGLFAAPETIAKYLTGTEGGWSNIFNVYSRWADTFDVDANPALRIMDLANMAIYGSLDLLSGHSLNLIFNEGLGLDIRYFKPVPSTVREVTSDLSGAVLMVATPLLIKKAGELQNILRNFSEEGHLFHVPQLIDEHMIRTMFYGAPDEALAFIALRDNLRQKLNMTQAAEGWQGSTQCIDREQNK